MPNFGQRRQQKAEREPVAATWVRTPGRRGLPDQETRRFRESDGGAGLQTQGHEEERRESRWGAGGGRNLYVRGNPGGLDLTFWNLSFGAGFDSWVARKWPEQATALPTSCFLTSRHVLRTPRSQATRLPVPARVRLLGRRRSGIALRFVSASRCRHHRVTIPREDVTCLAPCRACVSPAT